MTPDEVHAALAHTKYAAHRVEDSETARTFWPRVIQVGDHWLWTYKRITQKEAQYVGQPLVFRRVPTHRVAAQTLGIRLPKTVGRKCLQDFCVNPMHLITTVQEKTLWLFLGHVAVGDGCWEWQGHRQKGRGNYGLLATMRAHRYSYKLFIGDPGDASVLHKCDNPPCVRPDHLFLGTQRDNVHDCMVKGRRAIGTRRSDAMTEETVTEARAARAAGATLTELSLVYGIDTGAMSALCRRRTWKHVA